MPGRLHTVARKAGGQKVTWPDAYVCSSQRVGKIKGWSSIDMQLRNSDQERSAVSMVRNHLDDPAVGCNDF